MESGNSRNAICRRAISLRRLRRGEIGPLLDHQQIHVGIGTRIAPSPGAEQDNGFRRPLANNHIHDLPQQTFLIHVLGMREGIHRMRLRHHSLLLPALRSANQPL